METDIHELSAAGVPILGTSPDATLIRPDFMVGNSNGDSAMMVAAGLMTFEQMVRNSQALDTMKPSEKVVSALHVHVKLSYRLCGKKR